MTWNEMAAQQRIATDRALRIDPDNDLALVAKASAMRNFDGEVARSIAISEQVLRRSPNFGPAHYSLAASLFLAGQARKALDHIEQAIARDPCDMLLRSYRARILHSLGDYEAVRSAAANCADHCGRMTSQWFLAMLAFATPAQFRKDFPLIIERAAAEGASTAELAEARVIADALILRRPSRLTRFIDDDAQAMPYAAIAARLIGFEEGLRFARRAADRGQAGAVVDILNEGRVTFTPEQRADPRYHELFRHPRLIRIATARRKAGVTAGLPVFPVKPYAGR